MKKFKNRIVLGYSLLLGLIILLPASCKKTDDVIPFVSVNEYLNLSLPSYLPLTIVNGWVYYQGAGNKGLIVVNVDGVNFAAYDRTCTFDPAENSSIVQVITNNVIAIDSICGSKFSILDGSIINGPAVQSLKRYQTSVSNNVLHIYN
jgi:nitrite reductase/ring-hydroxylating ferredoxin subunit